MSKKRGLVLMVSLGLIDQGLKILLKDSDRVLIKGVLALHGTRNTGAAFSLLSDYPQLLTLLSVLLFAVLLFVNLRHERGIKSLCLWVAAGGALGNLIDRIFRGYVLDYIELLFMRFAIFNFADCLIVSGLLCYALLTLFQREEKA
ncbi:MAG: signal peptidase II [Christensenellales bacterium]|jgi:signal peptidase II|nr:signal peptidase II [Clostridiales bacterium]